MTAAARHFDALDYVDQARALGVDERVAKYQARQMEQVIDIAVNTARLDLENKELATKKDTQLLQKEIKELDLKIEQVRTEIHQSKFELVIWLAGFFVASGLIQHFFK